MNFSNQLNICFAHGLVQTKSSLPCSEIRHLLSTAYADSTGHWGLENNKFSDKKCCSIEFIGFLESYIIIALFILRLCLWLEERIKINT